MKKIALFIILILVSCTNKRNNITEATIQEYNPTTNTVKKTITDSVKNNFLDTEKTKNSPVKIISASLLKDIKLTFKNTTPKNIKAIKFEWYCENVFDKPASGQFFFVKGISRGHTDVLLKSKKIESKIWEDFSTDAYTILAARAYYIAFADGTKWELK